jgi:hypothetical protein
MAVVLCLSGSEGLAGPGNTDCDQSGTAGHSGSAQLCNVHIQYLLSALNLANFLRPFFQAENLFFLNNFFRVHFVTKVSLHF